MTIIGAISLIDALKPNGYTQIDKIGWLSTLDGMIKNEIIDTHEGGESITFNGYDDTTSIDTVLLVPAPYDDIYVRWLEAQIDYANGEYNKYNNSITLYNSAYSGFEKYYHRTNKPISKAWTHF